MSVLVTGRDAHWSARFAVLRVSASALVPSGWRAEWEAPTDRDHRTILGALRAGQVETAAAVLSRHVLWVGQRPKAGKASGVVGPR
ncbi:hypothetical protein [Azorhizobium sp. AG788]|uniref:hypothetical protein n=1 Tax=Azorhizobium sp. AG788 TaxID=2183897 RepID=UPI00313A37A2